MNNWENRIYNEKDPSDLKTLYAQLSRIATNRAVYLSIIKMTTENQINVGSVFMDFITDGYSADLVITIRRLVESNHNKPPDKQVNSIKGLIENLDDQSLLKRINKIDKVLGDAPNKIYSHLDLKFSDGERELNYATYDDLHNVINELFDILTEVSDLLGVVIPANLIPTNQFDWAQAFDYPWRAKGFDDSDIWNEL